MPSFSVIIPVYNKVRYLQNALQALYSQSFLDFEIIAVDDGSTDGSLKILERHAQQGRLRLYRRKRPGAGGYAARNYGAKRATAKWLLFLDADDWCSPDHLAEFHSAIERTKTDDIKLYVNAYAKVIKGRIMAAVAYPYQGIVSRQKGLELFSRSDYIHMNGVCIDRQCFLSSGGFPEKRYRRGGDVYFWIRMLASMEKSHYSRVVTSYWKIDNSGVSNDLKNLAHVHPAKDVLMALPITLKWKEAYYAKKAINRKLVSWAVEKKGHGISFSDDILSLYFAALSVKQVMHCLMLLLPTNLFVRFRLLVIQAQ